MRLISFLRDSTPTYGVVINDRVLDLGSIFGSQVPDLKSLIAQKLESEVLSAVGKYKPDLNFADLTLLPVIPNPGQIFCIGLNYSDHVQETGRQVAEDPVVFLRVNESQVAHQQNMLRPNESVCLDYEAEIAVVIGKPGRRISESEAWSHISGYACYNDGSVRDWQLATSQWTAGKNFFKTGGFGPWMVTSDEIAPGQVMRLQMVLNGAVLQDSTTDKMIHSIAKQIAYISTFTPLSPGDVIVTGTPGGIGSKRSPPVFLKAGDICEVVVDAIGTLQNGVRDE